MRKEDVLSNGAATDQVLEAVMELVATPDLARVHERVVALRDQFPLQRPMSALLVAEPGADTLLNSPA